MPSHTLSESNLATEKKWPCYVRSTSGPVKCHPVQLARARLGDIRGAVYLPIAEASSNPSTVATTSVSLFRNSGTQSPASPRTLSPELKSRTPFSSHADEAYTQQSDARSAAVHCSNEVNDDVDAAESVVTRLSSTFSIQDGYQSCSPASSLCHGSDANKCQNHSLDKLPKSLMNNIKHVDARNKARTLDGTCEKDSTLLQNSQVQPPETERTDFVSVGDVSTTCSTDRTVDESSYFLDPFTGSPALEDAQSLDFSGASGYLRPTAFPGHRDTFARLRPSCTFESDETDLMYNPSQRRSSIDFSVEAGKRFPGHRDTLARLHFNQNKSKLIPTQILDKILLFLSFDDYKSLRLTCRQWYKALPCVMVPPALRLPAEVLHHIYQHLQPCDFDAARHACRSWFLASLDRNIGRSMMKKAGCYPAFLADIDHRRQILHSRHLRRLQENADSRGRENVYDCQDDDEDTFNEEWLISKRLATECRLSAGWHGTGLRGHGHSTTRLTTTDVVDFNKLIPLSDEEPPSRKFTVSACGQFVLIVVGTDIIVYSLESDGRSMQPRVRLNAGKRVLNVSMDSSSGRYAVGALLEGRVGMFWDIDDIFIVSSRPSVSGEPMSPCLQTDIYGSVPIRSTTATPSSMPRWREVSLTAERGRARPAKQHRDVHCVSTYPRYSSSSNKSSVLTASDLDTPDPSHYPASLPLRTKPSKIYKNIGCSTDRPRSVAICPQRNCIAFGCRTGIELHWVDALTGRDLNRWFPLAAPSDFLCFLPQRSGLDSVKKLRLISSSIDERSLNCSRYSTRNFDSEGSEDRSERRNFGTEDCDHFHAVPLSDGVHMLFTDPETGLLCLGSDGPTGGPTKLVRKACMVPPASVSFTKRSLSCYAVGRDLSWGVRIIAAYDDGSVFLYSIPSDYFERIRHIRSSSEIWDEMAGAITDGPVVEQPNAANFFQSTSDPPTPDSRTSFRSLKIKGAFICRVNPDVEDLQVDCHGGSLRVWIFNHSGQARKMDLYVPRNYLVRPHVVDVDGSVQCMTEPTHHSDVFVGFDGKGETTGDDQSPLSASSPRVKFLGLDGACDDEECCDSFNYEEELERLEGLHQKHRDMYPEQSGHFVPQGMMREGSDEKLSLEVLTDFRNTMLLSPYMLNLE